MFTGLIQDVGVVKSVEKQGDWRFVISSCFDMSRFALGASVACNGCCLTVVDKGDDWLAFDVSKETMDVTTLKNWQAGTKVNLEPSLKLGDELGGHLVSGHVDHVVQIRFIEPENASHRLTFDLPLELAPYVAPKGSIAIDGISLTVNEVGKGFFGVNIIPHTWEKTNLSALKSGDFVNIEIDMLARYVARMREVEAA